MTQGDIMVIDRKISNLEERLKAIEHNDPLLTVQDVASILKSKEMSVRKLFNNPRFPAKKIKNIGWRVRASKFYQYFDNLKQYENE